MPALVRTVLFAGFVIAVGLLGLLAAVHLFQTLRPGKLPPETRRDQVPHSPGPKTALG